MENGVYIGLDIGGTKILAAAADSRGRLVRRRKIASPADGAEGLRSLFDLVDDLAAAGPIAAIGAACGGPLDRRSGLISPLHQPGWHNMALGAALQERYNVPFRVEVDTDAAALAEGLFGGRKAERLLYVTLSTGVGGGLLVDGEIYRGAGGVHPEIGHQQITRPEETVLCACGAFNCLEAFVSGTAIRRRFNKAAATLDEDEWKHIGSLLGIGLRNAAVLYAPDLIVLGGGVALGGGATLLQAARRVMERNLKLLPVPELRFSELGYETALMGAIALALPTIKQ